MKDQMLTIRIQKADILNLLISGVEGGSGYWARDMAPLKRVRGGDFYESCLAHGFTITDRETGDVLQATAEDMETALHRMHQQYRSHFADLIKGDIDAETGDVFLQLCVFTEVIYG